MCVCIIKTPSSCALTSLPVLVCVYSICTAFFVQTRGVESIDILIVFGRKCYWINKSVWGFYEILTILIYESILNCCDCENASIYSGLAKM